MKEIVISLLALTSLATFSWGQVKEPFCCTKAGTELKWIQYDAKGNETGATSTVIDAVSGSNGNYTITQTTTISQNGTPVMNPVKSTASVVDGDCSLVLGGGLAIEVDSNVPLLPASLAAGRDLGTGTIVVNVSGIKMTQEITSSKCTSREELETAAGTFDCYVVESVYNAKLGPIKINGKIKTYYSRGVGMVKQITYDKRGKVSSEQILVSFK